MSSLRAFSALLDGRMKRGALGSQLMAYQLTQAAQKLLDQMLPSYALQDVKAVSCVRGELRVACRNPHAREEVRRIADPLMAAMLAEHQIAIQVLPQLRTDAWRE